MHRRLLALGVVGISVVLAGCSTAMRPVPLTAPHGQWEALGGEWRGDYRMDGYDRHGTIAFKLVALEEQASGEVLMISDRHGWPYSRDHPSTADPRPSIEPRTQLLTIKFVAAEDGTISGAMDPYWDPDRRCMARASFTGRVTGDEIAGRVVSTCENDVQRLQGRWRVRKRAPGGT